MKTSAKTQNPIKFPECTGCIFWAELSAFFDYQCGIILIFQFVGEKQTAQH
jgi:hypothetical protein